MISDLPGDSFGGMVDVLNHPQSSSQEPPHGPYYADQSPVGNHFTAPRRAAVEFAGAWRQTH